MTEQELIDECIQERINMLLLELEKAKSKQSADVENKLIQAELFIKNLPELEKELMEYYVNYYLVSFFKEEAFLYRNGFLDGVRVMNFLITL